MKKAIKWILIGLFAVAVVWTMVFLYKKSQPQPVVYEKVKASCNDIIKKTVATGKIEPRNEVMIKPQISGIISKIYKEAGAPVKAGEIIALVQVIPEMSQLSAAQSRVNVAKIDLDQVTTDFNRNKELYEKKVISSEEYEKSRTQFLKSKEELQTAQDNLEIVKEGISKSSGNFSTTQVRSTITGTILDIPVKVGNSVIQSNNFNDGTTIAIVANMNDMIFKGKIDETEVGRVKEGMPITLTIGAMQDQQFDAVLEYVSPKGVEENGAILFEIKAAAKIPEGVTIRSGYSANAEIILSQRLKALSVPESTVEFKGDSTFLYLASVKGGDTTYVKTPVKIGQSDGINIEILSGLDSTRTIRGKEIIQEKK